MVVLWPTLMVSVVFLPKLHLPSECWIASLLGSLAVAFRNIPLLLGEEPETKLLWCASEKTHYPALHFGFDADATCDRITRLKSVITTYRTILNSFMIQYIVTIYNGIRSPTIIQPCVMYCSIRITLKTQLT